MDTFRQHVETRSRLRQTIDQLKNEGATLSQLIEAMRNELSLLHIEDDQVNADSLQTSSADPLPKSSKLN
jgi:hypothetical protein